MHLIYEDTKPCLLHYTAPSPYLAWVTLSIKSLPMDFQYFFSPLLTCCNQYPGDVPSMKITFLKRSKIGRHGNVLSMKKSVKGFFFWGVTGVFLILCSGDQE